MTFYNYDLHQSMIFFSNVGEMKCASIIKSTVSVCLYYITQNPSRCSAIVVCLRPRERAPRNAALIPARWKKVPQRWSGRRGADFCAFIHDIKRENEILLTRTCRELCSPSYSFGFYTFKDRFCELFISFFVEVKMPQPARAVSFVLLVFHVTGFKAVHGDSDRSEPDQCPSVCSCVGSFADCSGLKHGRIAERLPARITRL